MTSPAGSRPPRIVLALGGHAIVGRGHLGTAEEQTAMVGAPGSDDGRGAVYVFAPLEPGGLFESDDAWSQRQRLSRMTVVFMASR